MARATRAHGPVARSPRSFPPWAGLASRQAARRALRALQRAPRGRMFWRERRNSNSKKPVLRCVAAPLPLSQETTEGGFLFI